MKYWYLKEYKDLKIKLIPDLTREINENFIMPKNYKDRYYSIKEADISKLEEEDLIIYLYCILNHEKIKNNKVILIIDQLLKIPDNSLPATNYSLMEMIEEIKNLKTIESTEEKLISNNVAACYTCKNVYYVDRIKYLNKKGYTLCPFCRNHTIYFDNDFIPMDYNFLRLANLYYKNTSLGCNYNNLKKIVKKSIKITKDSITNYNDGAIFKYENIKEDDIILNNNSITFLLKRIKFKKSITSKEEKQIELIFNKYFSIIEKNLIRDIYIDTSIINGKDQYSLALSLFLTCITNFGKNQYLKTITFVCNNEEIYNIYNDILNDFLE